LRRWGHHYKEEVNALFTLGKSLLHRTQEQKLLTESERHRYEDELDDTGAECFNYKSPLSAVQPENKSEAAIERNIGRRGARKQTRIDDTQNCM
jgi:hypothetical protein